MPTEVITAAHMRGLILPSAPEGAIQAQFPAGTLVVEPGETRGRFGALRLFHGPVPSFNEDQSFINGSTVLFRVEGVQTPIRIQFARQDLTGHEINLAGDITERLLFAQRQLDLAKSAAGFIYFSASGVRGVDVLNPADSEFSEEMKRSLDRLARQRNGLIKKAAGLGITLILNPNNDSYTNVRLLSVNIRQQEEATDLYRTGLAKELGIESTNPLMRKFEDLASFFDHVGLRYRLDYFFGQYQGHPRGVKENASATHYHAEQGVELSKMLKSYALQTPDHPLILIHLPGDHQLDMAEVAKLLNVSQDSLDRADIARYGIEPGTVNPFLLVDPNTGRPIPQIFSNDFFQDAENVMNNRVFASSGDKAYYVMVDKRRLVEALRNANVPLTIADISKAEEGSIRVSADRAFAIVSGDDSISGDDLGSISKRAINRNFQINGVEPADRRMPPNRTFSYPELADSIEKKEYDRALRAQMLVIIDDLRQFAIRQNKPLLVAFSSMAMQSIAREMLADIEELEYVDPKPALEARVAQILEEFEVAGTMLVGLPSSYDEEISAFAGYILEQAMSIDEETKKQLESFVVEECKRKAQLDIESNKFYNAIDKVLMGTVDNNREALKGKNFVVVLGASEFANFAMKFHKTNNHYYPIRTSGPEAIKVALEEVADDKYNKDKTRLILVSPIEVLADEIAERTVTVTVA